MENELKIRGFCTYCKDPIYEGDDCIVVGENLYHLECDEIMGLYYDSFDIAEEN